MKSSTYSKLSALVCSFALLAASARAGSIINNFTTPLDYVANGIIGDTNWDGVYLRFGDVQNGNAGGSGNGNTTIANSAVTYAGYLGVRSIGSDWAGAGDDGFYLWKLVSGDFDVSVQSSPFNLTGGTTYDNGANNFCGLLVRAWNTNLSGAPVSFTSTNAAENFLLNWRFQEFGLNQVRQSTNGADLQNYNYPDSNTDLSTTRYFRIVRSGNTFTFYWKTNAPDSWVLITNNALFPNGSISRGDWNNQPVQVGIAQADFNSVTHDAVFTDFELSGPNVTFPPFPAAPSALVTTATNTGGSLSLSWTVGNPGDSSLVIMRSSGNIQGSPIQGTVYPADAAFGDSATLLSVGGQYVVYNGTGNSVTVTNLAGNNLNYTVAVYEYTNPATPVYNTASPATNTFPGPGVITSVITSIAPTNIPVGGATLGKLFATFTSGGGTVDESASATWTSSDSTTAAFNGSVLSALAAGSVTVTGAFGAFTATAVITIHPPVFTDSFGAYQDYIANGVQGSIWDGLFLNYGDVPLTTATDNRKGNDGAAGATSVALANTNVLYVEAAGSSWFVAGDDGPFLYKIVTGDFQASVHVGPMSIINNCDGGIMARLYNNSGTALQGGGGGTSGTETHINLVKIQNGTPAVRRTIDSGGTTIVNGLNATDRWFLMQRVNSTNFFLYEGATGTNWVLLTSLVVNEASNSAPMEVGLEQEMRTASDGFVPFDTLMIDGPGITPPATPPPPANSLTETLNGDLSMTFSWVAASAVGAPIRSALVMRQGGPITAQPTLSQAASIGGTGSPVSFGSALTGVNLGGGNWLVFATGNPAASTNVTCTVNNLIPGAIYYAAVYTFTGSGGSKSFNNVLPPSGATTTVQDGSLLSVEILAPPAIPLGGAQVLQVLGHYQGGAVVNVSAFANVVSLDTSKIVTTNGILTGLALGTAQIQADYKGFTNTVSATVRTPAFTDNFGVNHDYLNNGITGSSWDGVYNPNTIGPNAGVQIPESSYVPGTGSGATVADANITTNNQLTITSSGDGWENDASGGFFLWKYVPLDFQAVVHIKAMDIAGYNMPGLLARAYSAGTNGAEIGSPFVLGTTTNAAPATVVNGESFVSYCRFEEFGIGTYPRLNVDSFVLQSIQPDPNDGKVWLLMYRTKGTDFSFYKRSSAAAPWENIPLKTSYHETSFANQPMQVGIMAGPWSGPGDLRTAALDNFMLDWTTAPTPVITVSGGNVIVSWPPDPQLVLQSTTSLSPPVTWSNESGATLGPTGYSLSFPLNAVTGKFFRLKQ